MNTSRWFVISVTVDHSTGAGTQELDELLSLGWEPYAVNGPGGWSVYHLRRQGGDAGSCIDPTVLLGLLGDIEWGFTDGTVPVGAHIEPSIN